jgi:N-methylhydantoinase B
VGDIITVQAGGGGGYGSPQARKTNALLEDLKLGYVTLDAAREIYGVNL